MLLQVGTCVLEIRRHHFAELAGEVIDGFEVNHGVVSVLDGHYRRSAASAQSEKCALCCKKMLTPTHRGRERASIKPPNIVMKGSSKQPIKSCRSEEHTSELQSLMRSSYAVFCLKKKTRLITTNSLLN